MKAKYVPDLTRQIAICEANYIRVLKLLPNFDESDQRDFMVETFKQKYLMNIEVLERFKYTSTLQITQQRVGDDDANQSANSDYLADVFSTKLLVRLYHDAKLAEVVSPHTHAQFKGKYPYPNDEMYQVDEKMQLNDYLAQWLSHCLINGYVANQPSPIY
jgi:uncharacterized protein YqiB (DUF1249 family)